MKKLFMLVVATLGLLYAGGDFETEAPLEPAINIPEVKADNSGLYVGGMIGASQTYKTGDIDWFEETTNTIDPAVGLLVGYDFGSQGSFSLAVEGRGMTTFETNDFRTETYGAYVKPYVTIFDNYKLYGLAGWNFVDFSKGSLNDNVDGFSFGGGLAYKVGSNTEVFADYVSNLWEKTVSGQKDTNFDTIMVGMTYKF